MGEIVDKLERAYRTLATGFGFALFFTMGVVYRCTVSPILAFWYRNDQRKKELAARRIVQLSFACFIGVMRFMRVMDLTVIHGERLKDPGRLICPSHPTLIDVVILISQIRNANCIVKAALMDSGAMRGPISTSGYITNDHGPALIDDCVESLRKGDTLLIFPEGTRTKPGVKSKLQHGAAAVALSARCNIMPVRITCEPPALMKGIAWYTIPKRRMHITVEVLDEIDIEPFLEDERTLGRPIAVRHLTQYMFNVLFPSFINSQKTESL